MFDFNMTFQYISSNKCSYLPLYIAYVLHGCDHRCFLEGHSMSFLGCCFIVRFARWSNPTRTLSRGTWVASKGWQWWRPGSKLCKASYLMLVPRSSANEPTPKEEKSKGPPQHLGSKGGCELKHFFVSFTSQNCERWTVLGAPFFYSTIVKHNFLLRLWLPLSRQQKAQQVTEHGRVHDGERLWFLFWESWHFMFF